MSIRPIDMMMMPPKSQEASQLQQSNQQKLTHAQEQASFHFNAEVKHNTQRPVEATRKDNENYRYDAKEKGNNSYSGKQKKRKKKEEQEEAEEKISKSRGFDMKI